MGLTPPSPPVWTMLKKTALFSHDGFPLVCILFFINLSVEMMCSSLFSKGQNLERVGISLAEDSSLKIVWDIEAEVWSRFWNWHWSRYWGWSLVEILLLKIGHHFEPEVWPRFGSWILTQHLTWLESSYYRTRVRSLAMLVSDWLTDWLTNSITLV